MKKLGSRTAGLEPNKIGNVVRVKVVEMLKFFFLRQMKAPLILIAK